MVKYIIPIVTLIAFVSFPTDTHAQPTQRVDNEVLKVEQDVMHVVQPNFFQLGAYIKQAWETRTAKAKLGKNEFLETVLEEVYKFKEFIKFKAHASKLMVLNQKSQNGYEIEPEKLAKMFNLGRTGDANPSLVPANEHNENLGSFGSSVELDKHIAKVRQQAAVKSMMTRTHGLITSLIGSELRELALLMAGLHPDGIDNQQVMIAKTHKAIVLKVIEYVLGLFVDILSAIFGSQIKIENTGSAFKQAKQEEGMDLLKQYWID